jgi:hypothetical protein
LIDKADFYLSNANEGEYTKSGLTKWLIVKYADSIKALYVGIEVFKEEDKSFPAAHPQRDLYTSQLIIYLMEPPRSTFIKHDRLQNILV